MVAAGAGHRYGGRKQFEELAGRPVVSWSLAAARSVADGTVLVVPPDGAGGNPGPPADEEVDVVVPGGATRATSVRAGLAAVPEDAAIVVVHDAVRPLAPPSLFEAVVAPVRSGAARGVVPVVPVADTLKRVEAGVVHSTVDREGLVAVQTPQAFDAATLRAAHRSGGEATDDAALLEGMGVPVCIVAGDPANLKVTRAGDLALAAALLATEGR